MIFLILHQVRFKHKEYEDTYTHGQGTDRIDYPPERCLLRWHGGYRWNALLPMNFGYKDGVIYLHSAQDGRSISILERNPKVCITFSIDHALVFQHPEVACSYRMRSKSVIAWGKVAYEEDFDKKVEALDIIMKQYSDKTFRYSDPAVRNVKIWTVDIDEVSCKEFGAPHKKSY